jgi:acyl-CoA synthetase (AMP-forming)/AMP-acid ligase II
VSATAAEPANVSLALRAHARAAPERLAVVEPGGRALAFGALERRADALARGLSALGLRPGDRASLFVPAGADLIAVTHALFRVGAVPVLIDPGLGRKQLLACVERVAPRALIAVPRAHAARLLFPRAFRSVELPIAVGRGMGFGAAPLAALERPGPEPFEPFAAGPDDDAAILFTSGSTGPAKGAVYTHGNFAAQLAALRELYALAPGEVDAACFPLFALFDHALGMTAVFPELDPSRPAACDPRKVAGAIESSGATFSFGSPAIWRRVLPWMQAEGRRFGALRRIAIAGAPVPPALVEGLRALLPPGGEVYTPYGATESLPVASIGGAELAGLRARTEAGAGTCLGRPAPGARVCAIRIDDGALERFDAALLVPDGEVGELCVQGPATTRSYAGEPGLTALAKLADPRGGFWHRLGDLGYADRDGRLWFCGRKAHRLETAAGMLFPVQVENAFLGVPGAARTALVGVGPRGAQRPVLVVEPEPGAARAQVLAEVERRRRERAAAAPITAVLLHRAFPVDVRHNAKIDRLALKAWAEGRLA